MLVLILGQPPKAARVNNHAMKTTPARITTRSNTLAAMAQRADRLVAHHMKPDARKAHTPAAATIKIPVSMSAASGSSCEVRVAVPELVVQL